MARGRKASTDKTNGGANIGFEEKLWQAADKLRSNMDAAEYKHVVLGLTFLKYISDAYNELHQQLKADKLGDPEDRDEYTAQNVFWVPKDARWSHLQANAKTPNIGLIIDAAMEAIEKANPTLKGVLPKDYARPALDKHRLTDRPRRWNRPGGRGKPQQRHPGPRVRIFPGVIGDSHLFISLPF